jgi:alpha-glucosidase
VVVYQVYPRSFQDSNGDGIGDLEGIRSRLDHLAWLGVDALWLSPIYPSPGADMGYDVSDYTDVDPIFGSLSDLDALVRDVHARGLKLLLDLVPGHTSIEHPWFREHPDWYIWRDRPNNWVSAFGGSAWAPLGGRRSAQALGSAECAAMRCAQALGSAECAAMRCAQALGSAECAAMPYYLHSFYREQADLDWRNPEVVAAMQGVLRFWLDRGVDGYRVDAIDRILKDPQLRDDPPATEPYGLPLMDEQARLALTSSGNAPDTAEVLATIRATVGDAYLVGEVYLPSAKWQPYTEYFDAVFAFELLFARWDASELRGAIRACTRQPGAAAWVMSNHDFGRLATRFGVENARAAAMLLLTLPGPAFLYQGDEIGQGEGPPEQNRYDRHGRDRFRTPMQWDASPTGGFTSGEPWLPVVDAASCNVEAQRDDPASMLALVRRLIALRSELGDGFDLLDAADGVVAFRRGSHLVAVNTTAELRPAPALSEPVLETVEGVLRGRELAPHAGVVAMG